MKLSVINNENAKVCSDCGGKCCKQSPGLVAPDHWGTGHAAKLKIVKALEGVWTIDKWEATRETDNRDVYYIRPRVKTEAGKWHVHYGWGGECILFVEGEGCALTFEERPLQCRALIPVAGKNACHYNGLHSGGVSYKLWLVKKWMKSPLQDWLWEVANEESLEVVKQNLLEGRDTKTAEETRFVKTRSKPLRIKRSRRRGRTVDEVPVGDGGNAADGGSA